MDVNVIATDRICDYCKNMQDYKNTGYSCRYWFNDELCRDAEDFEGKELIEVEL